MDTTNILFICGGTFVGLDDIIGKRQGRKMIGFGSDVQVAARKKTSSELLRETCVDDVLEFGLIPELVGRLPIISTLEELQEPDLVRVLTEPRNSIVPQVLRNSSRWKSASWNLPPKHSGRLPVSQKNAILVLAVCELSSNK